jgi:hypothetical protein
MNAENRKKYISTETKLEAIKWCHVLFTILCYFNAEYHSKI